MKKLETPSPWPARASLFALIAAVLLLGSILVGRTLSRGDDFMVFYRVAQRFWDGVRPYDPVTYGNMVFKYPPWILPAFLPFGFLDVKTAKAIWGLIEVFSLVAIVVKMHRGMGPLPPVRPWLQAIFLVSLFGLFGSHGMTGQITLPMLALAVWIDPVRSRFGFFLILVWAFSAKVTSAFPLIHAGRRRNLFLQVLGGAVVFTVLSLPIYFRSYEGHSKAMRTEWAQAMFSGTEDVSAVRIGFTTREVQGLPSLLLRKGAGDEKNSKHVLFSIVISFIAITGFWWSLSRRLPSTARWIGWLALLPAVQALAWFHVFLFVYPLLVFGAESAIRAERFKSVALFFFSVFLIGAVTVKTLGEFGGAAELWSVKLWGTLLAAYLFSREFKDSAEIS